MYLYFSIRFLSKIQFNLAFLDIAIFMHSPVHICIQDTYINFYIIAIQGTLITNLHVTKPKKTEQPEVQTLIF